MIGTNGTDKIIPALLAAQKEMGAAMKNAVNPHLKNKYADLASVVEAAYPALHKYGICVVQTSRETVPPVMVTTLFHESGQWIESSFPMIIPDCVNNPMQAYGAACSYARRYGLSAIVGMIAEDTDAEGAGKDKPTQTQTIKPPMAKQPSAGGGATATLPVNTPRSTPSIDQTTTANTDIVSVLKATLGNPPEMPKKPDLSNCKVVKGMIEKVEATKGVGPKGPWERFGVFINGTPYATFDTKLGSAAVEAWTNKEQVRLFVKANGKHTNVAWLELLGDLQE